jgi:hypothetical protein
MPDPLTVGEAFAQLRVRWNLFLAAATSSWVPGSGRLFADRADVALEDACLWRGRMVGSRQADADYEEGE